MKRPSGAKRRQRSRELKEAELAQKRQDEFIKAAWATSEYPEQADRG